MTHYRPKVTESTIDKLSRERRARERLESIRRKHEKKQVAQVQAAAIQSHAMVMAAQAQARTQQAYASAPHNTLTNVYQGSILAGQNIPPGGYVTFPNTLGGAGSYTNIVDAGHTHPQIQQFPLANIPQAGTLYPPHWTQNPSIYQSGVTLASTGVLQYGTHSNDVNPLREPSRPHVEPTFSLDELEAAQEFIEELRV